MPVGMTNGNVGNGGIVGSMTLTGTAVGAAIADYWIHYMGTPQSLHNATYVLAAAALGAVAGVVTHLKTRLKEDSNNNGIPDVLERLQRIEAYVKQPSPDPQQELPAGNLNNGG